MSTEPLRVYLAGPVTSCEAVDVPRELGSAARLFGELLARGYAPYAPQLNWFAAFASPAAAGVGQDGWMRLCYAWLGQSDVLVRLPGESRGADLEVAFANRAGIPVVHGDFVASEWVVAHVLGILEKLR